MKLLLSGFALLSVAFSVIACPDLTGEYNRCTTGDLEMDQEYRVPSKISVQVKNSDSQTSHIFVFNNISKTYTAGQTLNSRRVVLDDMFNFEKIVIDSATTPSCSANQLLVKTEETFNLAESSKDISEIDVYFLDLFYSLKNEQTYETTEEGLKITHTHQENAFEDSESDLEEPVLTKTVVVNCLRK